MNSPHRSVEPAPCTNHLLRPGQASRDGVRYGREVYSAKASRRGVIAALIVSSEAWRCSEGVYKIRQASLPAKAGSGSGCALPHRPPSLAHSGHSRRFVHNAG